MKLLNPNSLQCWQSSYGTSSQFKKIVEDKQDKNIMAMNITSKNKYDQGSFSQFPLQTSHLECVGEDLTITELENSNKRKQS